MTDWTQVQGTQPEKPLEVDTCSSTSTVYLRKNIEQIEVEDPTTKEKVTMWQYDERQMTPAEYTQYQMIQESTETITAFQEQAVIDAYTEELIAGGVI